MKRAQILERVVRLREALADGEYQLAASVAESLELDLLGRARRASARCPRCGVDCEWPGLLKRHVSTVHWEQA